MHAVMKFLFFNFHISQFAIQTWITLKTSVALYSTQFDPCRQQFNLFPHSHKMDYSRKCTVNYNSNNNKMHFIMFSGRINALVGLYKMKARLILCRQWSSGSKDVMTNRNFLDKYAKQLCVSDIGVLFCLLHKDTSQYLDPSSELANSYSEPKVPFETPHHYFSFPSLNQAG